MSLYYPEEAVDALNDKRVAVFVVAWTTLMLIGAVYVADSVKQKYDTLIRKFEERGCSALIAGEIPGGIEDLNVSENFDQKYWSDLNISTGGIE